MKLQTKLLMPIFSILIVSFVIVGLVSVYNTSKVESSVLINMDDKNITLADMLAYMISEDPSILEPETMIQLADLFGVDEVHVTDEYGVLRWGNIQEFIDNEFDFHTSDQTIPLLVILDDPSLKIAQEPQPRGTDGTMFQYISVARIDQKGIVQVGVSMDTLDGIRRDGSNALIMIIALGAAVIAFATLLMLFIVKKVITTPMANLTSYMRKASTTGNLIHDSEEVEKIKACSDVNDEIGQTIASCSAFIGHVDYIVECMSIVAEGDLTLKIMLLSDNDTLGLELKKMISNLDKVFKEIKTSAVKVSVASRQVADGAQSLAQGSSEQTFSVDELSNKIMEIEERTRANAIIADKTAKLSESIKEGAEKGNLKMNEMIKAVEEINEASHSINKIISTIDDIAFQTNILALNAAVEAARAGVHGKGFAVVADEVRTLAVKSAEAAKNTGAMIQNSIEKAKLGSEMAGETATSLDEIIEDINESNQFAAEIAKASKQQSFAISQIKSSIDQVANVIQHNNAAAEESAAVSEEMSSQSDILQQMIAYFKLPC